MMKTSLKYHDIGVINPVKWYWTLRMVTAVMLIAGRWRREMMVLVVSWKSGKHSYWPSFLATFPEVVVPPVEGGLIYRALMTREHQNQLLAQDALLISSQYPNPMHALPLSVGLLWSTPHLYGDQLPWLQPRLVAGRMVKSQQIDAISLSHRPSLKATFTPIIPLFAFAADSE